jgi:hypothetical protein
LLVFCSILDILAQLYAFIKCLKAGIHQSILPNRRITKVQQQSMDLLHRIGDATIVDFADPGFLTELESADLVFPFIRNPYPWTDIRYLRLSG